MIPDQASSMSPHEARRRRPGARPPEGGGEAGHALLIVVCMCMIMLIGTTVAMKVWSTVIQRDREDELIFRGRQYAMALYLYQKTRGAFPTDLKMLDEKGEGGKYYLRRQYKDPITGKDFGIVMAGPNNTPIPDEPIDDPNLDADRDGQADPGAPGAAGASPTMAPPTSFGSGGSAFGTPTAGAGLPIMGVHSKSKAFAIGPAKWRDLEKYNQWLFLATDMRGQGPGAPGRPGAPGAPGAPGTPGGVPGGAPRGAIPGADRGGMPPPPPPPPPPGGGK